MTHRGFSLVELSIVLVILGLLTGGILAGQSLIRAAELRAVTSEYQRYSASMQTFRDKYMSIPGDMNNAVSFWNRQVNQAWCLPTSGATVTTPGTCNGDGDGIFENAGAVSQSGELFQFWRHLALAGLIEGNFDGLAGSANTAAVVVGTNAPISRLGSSIAWSIRYAAGASGDNFSNWTASSMFVLGTAPTGNEDGDGPTLRPEEMWGIDTKLDDGKPAYGSVQSYNATARPNCVTSDTPSSATYLLTSSTTGCSLFIRF